MRFPLRPSFISLVLAIIFNIGVTARAQETALLLSAPESVGISSDSLATMNTYFHMLVDEAQLAGIQTAIIRHGKLIHFDSYGYSNMEEGTAIDDQSIFRIFSMTKPIVSVALMQLYEQGLFKLDDPLSDFIPEFKSMLIHTDSMLTPAKGPIKIIDLLRHTSGFNYGRGPNTDLNQLYANANVFASKSNKEFVEKMAKLPLQFEPGTDWQYGLSTNICGYLIEVLSGKSLSDYLRDHIFRPLHMHDTHFQLPEEKIERFSVGYGWDTDLGLTITEPQKQNRYTEEVTLFNGGGGLVSTTADYLKFCQLILNKGKTINERLLKEETIDLMLKDHLSDVRSHQERLRLPFGELGFGLGFAIRGNTESDLERVYSWGGAVGTYFKIDMEHDLAYIMMIQLSPYRHLGLRQLFQDFVDGSILD